LPVLVHGECFGGGAILFPENLIVNYGREVREH